MTKENRYYLGKCDYNGSGRKNCKAYITWSLKAGRFARSAEIWNPRETDIYCGGQCVDAVAACFPNDKKAREMVAVWGRWHLNDMRGGSPAQRAFLADNYLGKQIPAYEDLSRILSEAGLNPDYSYVQAGIPYRYGQAWLFEEIPADVVGIIESWSAE